MLMMMAVCLKIRFIWRAKLRKFQGETIEEKLRDKLKLGMIHKFRFISVLMQSPKSKLMKNAMKALQIFFGMLMLQIGKTKKVFYFKEFFR